MDNHNQKDDERSSQIIESDSKRRDDTPSFIRNVEARADMLNPQRQSEENLPVLTMPKSIRVWRTIRWPLFVVIVIVVLATVGLITNDTLVAQSVERTIEGAQRAEVLGAVSQIETAGKTLSSLAKRHPTRKNVQMACAWQAIIQSVLLGPEQPLAKKAQIVLNSIGADDSSIGWAALAGLSYTSGKYQKALEQAKSGLLKHPQEPRLKLVHAWALSGLGQNDEARDVLNAAMQSQKTYTPFIIAQIALALEKDNRLEALNHAAKLLAASPGHLYGSLITVELALPEWGGKALTANQVSTLVNDITTLEPTINSAPPKLLVLGEYLVGRVNLAAGRYKAAVSALNKVAEKKPDADVLAWYAVAMRHLKDPNAALKLLDKYPDQKGPETLDIRAQCLLAYHRVNAAQKVIEELDATGTAQKNQVRNLRWMLSIRRGDREGVLAWMPDRIDADKQWLAIEMYYLLKAAGDFEGIKKLTTVFSPEIASCADAILAWHGKNARNAIGIFGDGYQETALCINALAIKMLKGHVKPARLNEHIKQVSKNVGLNLRLQIDLAMAKWLVNTRDNTIKALDAVWRLKPEGTPVLCALGQAYLDIGQPNRVLEILGGVDEPEGIALKILAARAAKKKDLASKLIKTAIHLNREKPHPALAFFALQAQYSNGTYYDVTERVTSILPKAGQWTAETAEIGAKAHNAIGDRADADRLLYQTSKTVSQSAGIDESLETRLAQIRLNIRRGGKSWYRALYLLNSLREEGISDPRISYNLAMVNIRDGNERLGLRYLRDALNLDPTYKPAYKQLISMGRLDEELVAKMKQAWPELKPTAIEAGGT